MFLELWELGRRGPEHLCKTSLHSLNLPALPKNISEIYGRLTISVVRSVARAILSRRIVQVKHACLELNCRPTCSSLVFGIILILLLYILCMRLYSNNNNNNQNLIVLGLCSLSHHSSATFIASLSFSGFGSADNTHVQQCSTPPSPMPSWSILLWTLPFLSQE